MTKHYPKFKPEFIIIANDCITEFIGKPVLFVLPCPEDLIRFFPLSRIVDLGFGMRRDVIVSIAWRK